jgi:hypothetical protein
MGIGTPGAMPPARGPVPANWVKTGRRPARCGPLRATTPAPGTSDAPRNTLVAAAGPGLGLPARGEIVSGRVLGGL